MAVPIAAKACVGVIATLEGEELTEAGIRRFDLLARRVAVIREVKAPTKREGGVVEPAEGPGGSLDAGGGVVRAEVEDDARVVAAGPGQERRLVAKDRADRAVDVFDARRAQHVAGTREELG